MYETNYHRASSLSDAASQIAGNEDAKLLAGGQTLIPTMKQRLAAPSDVIDIRNLDELKGIDVSGGTVTIGAAVCHADVANSDAVKGAIPALAALAGKIGDPHVRHMGTIGGSIANNDPAADYPAAVLGLDATVVTNKREIAAADYFKGLFETALEEDEIIVKVVFQVPEKAGYAKFPNPASRYAMCGVMAAKMTDGSVRVAVTGAGNDGVFRHAGMEQALSSNWSADAVVGASVDPNDMLSDLHGSADYRANLVVVMAKRAVEAAG
ncbi:FAD binding domain-containing protein [Rhodobium gokarnense]|uniref:Carbon-monoxide dehydrogenase medium subunit n=1 Tax=Rhodobium gokarnense TaxID=364296 RepID=A0ABT3HGM7_9HYPH|nr:xanthine dehydrogenase family protein subunit M [Rhodobium gokarnense]MCW2309552.1 carbon-monoxide dehydrogenase medium subunit [Rhodobium gokarnense]